MTAARVTLTKPLIILPLALLAGLVVGVGAVSSPMVGLLLAGMLLAMLAGIFSPSLMHAALLLCGVSGLFVAFQMGPFTGGAALTILLAGATWLFWLTGRRLWSPELSFVILPLVLLIAWGIGSMLAWYRPNVAGIQNLLVFAAFAGTILITASQSYARPELRATLGRTLGFACAAASGLYIIEHFGFNAVNGLGPRGYALFALVGVAWYTARWRYGDRRALLVVAGILAIIALSLSRLALGGGLLMLAIAIIRPRGTLGLVKLAAAGIISLFIGYQAALRIEPLRSRFFEGDLSIEIAGVRINAMGRMEFWELTLASFREAPWTGKGAGSVQEMIELQFPGLGHPHSDYLRLLHDYGLIGFALFLVSFLAMFVICWSAWQRADGAGRTQDAAVHMAAFLALLALALGMATDNSIVYFFVTVPVGVLVGLSFGSIAAERAARAVTAPTHTQPALHAGEAPAAT